MKPSWLPARLEWLWALDDAAVLRALVVGEAEAEPPAGMLAVADATVNRAILAREGRVTWWGRDLKEVCLARHQFSPFWSDYDKRLPALRAGAFRDTVTGGFGRGRAVWQADRAVTIALKRFHGEPDATGDRSFKADHFYAPRGVVAPPAWAAQYTLTCIVGGHRFYTSLYA